MKERNDFDTQEHYEDYLLHYYSGCALTGILANPTYKEGEMNEDCLAYDATVHAKSLIKELKETN